MDSTEHKCPPITRMRSMLTVIVLPRRIQWFSQVTQKYVKELEFKLWLFVCQEQ